MKYLRTLAFVVVLIFTLCPIALIHAQESIRISEFMAVNDSGFSDEERNEEDWIEIHNAGPNTVDLEGWHLTDDISTPTKWTFPQTTLAPDAYLIVFASGKDRREPSGVLHTNFKLQSSGEYLGLIRPDGQTAVSEFSPTYPIQAPDVSYGFGAMDMDVPLVPSGAPARALIPLDGSLEPSGQDSGTIRPWTLQNLDDSSWLTGVTGVGYGYAELIGLDVSGMQSVNQSVYIRIPFEVDHPSSIHTLTLRMRYEDGLIAYINGQEVAQSNAPDPSTETWNSGASANRINRVAVYPVDLAITQLDSLQVGTNMLAIQGLNQVIGSPTMLIFPELLATMHLYTDESPHYFPTPTPGLPNNAGVERLGPIISDNGHAPEIPGEDDDLWITVRISQSFDPVDTVALHYRVMFDNEVTIPLHDDGTNGDGIRGDGVYVARIPAETFSAGQMVRWFVTAIDTAGRESRFPAFLDPLNSPEYSGTVVRDWSLVNPLPVLHWFIANPSAANGDVGTRCTLFYDGEFYDNLLINIHGQSSRGFPKKSYDIDFHPGHNFKWEPGQPRADDINLMTTYPDKAQMRNLLAYGIYRDADCPYHWVFPVRVQQNGAFWGTAHVMENGDEDWLIRMGLNTEGALYKMYNRFNTASHANNGAEKKTRKDEDNADLSALYNGLGLSSAARRRYLYDNLNIPQVINFLAVRAITGDTDCCHKNYYFYRDTGLSNEWQMWPWDVDLSFGRVWNSSETYWNENLITNTALFVGQNNRLPSAVFGTPEMRQMYLRRVRTLMDEFLKAPNTRAEEELYFEPRIDMWATLIAPDAALDAAKWGSDAWGNGSTSSCCPQSLWEAAEELRDSYLPERRRQLFNRLSSGSHEIPNAQPDSVSISFGNIDTLPASGNLDEQYIQLQNVNGFAVDISGWTLSREQDNANLFTFRGGTVIPANETLYVVVNRVAFRSRSLPRGGTQVFFVVGDLSGQLAAQDETLHLIDSRQVTVDSIITAHSGR